MMNFLHHRFLLPALCSLVFVGCASQRPASPSRSEGPLSVTPPSTSPRTDSAGVAPRRADSIPLVAPLDSTSPPPRPTVLIPGQNNFAVRTKLVPRVMGNGWVLMVNKPDSLEFFRPADSVLTTYLFGLAPSQPMKLRLRFILSPEGDGTRIALMGHLIGKDGQLPYVAQEAPLIENLTSLQADLLSAPPMQPPEKPGKKKKK